ncbi:MAG: polysaccharide biosynthesis C-terminal domain-containing protein [Chitinophagales bacterium]
MRPLRRLAGQTAIYGLSTILVRMLNYLLAPLHTNVFSNQADYGVISELYAYVTFLNVIFMYGMETAFFRFASRNRDQEWIPADKVFGSAQSSLLVTTFLLTSVLLMLSGRIAEWLSYPGHANYVIFFALIIASDTLVNIPFAKLRLENRPWKYFGIKLTNICINISLNFFFLWPALQHNYDMFEKFGFVYQPEYGVAYVFIANLVASAVTLLIFLPGMFQLHFDSIVWRKLMRYGLPLIIIGLAGMVNETLDRVLLKYWGSGTLEENLQQVGIYSAVYKISIFMTLAVQGFRMGAEPFFFSQATEKNAPATYAQVMKYFVLICCFIFLGVGMFPDVFKIIIGPEYRSGLHIVPILLMANLFLGIYYNQGVWYKLTDKTAFATIIPIAGALITLTLNIILIPRIGYTGSAWATLCCYGSMVLLSHFIGQRYYHVPYNLRKILFYLAAAFGLCMLGLWIYNHLDNTLLAIALRILLFGVFFLAGWWLDIRAIIKRAKN